MRKADVQVPGTYLMNHSSGRIRVRLTSVKLRVMYGSRGPERTMTHWLGTNLKTGRQIEVKSAAKLRQRLAEPPVYFIGNADHWLKPGCIIAGPFSTVPELAPGQHLFVQTPIAYALVASHPRQAVAAVPVGCG